MSTEAGKAFVLVELFIHGDGSLSTTVRDTYESHEDAVRAACGLNAQTDNNHRVFYEVARVPFIPAKRP